MDVYSAANEYILFPKHPSVAWQICRFSGIWILANHFRALVRIPSAAIWFQIPVPANRSVNFFWLFLLWFGNNESWISSMPVLIKLRQIMRSDVHEWSTQRQRGSLVNQSGFIYVNPDRSSTFSTYRSAGAEKLHSSSVNIQTLLNHSQLINSTHLE